ncbi:MAG: glycosyl hydrolase, partial [Verrucomicrobiota bacterium]
MGIRQQSWIKAAGYMLLAAWTLGQPVSAEEQKRNSPPNWGQCKEVSWDALKRDFRNPDMIYAPFMFWFWDEPLNAGKMAEMSRVMSSQGFNPGYAHARQSMVGTPSLPAEQWLGDAWFSSFGAALQEAEKQNAYLGYCDEYWWPSFRAHGRLLKAHPELIAESLRWEVIDTAGGNEVQVPASFVAVAAELAQPITEPAQSIDAVSDMKVPLGKWIWDPKGSATLHSCWFRTSFDVPVGRSVKQAVIRATADNAYTVFLNGKKVGEGDNWQKPGRHEVTSSLIPGRNVIAVEGRNLEGAYGLTLGLALVLDDGSTMKVLSGSSWKTSLVQAAGWETADFADKDWNAAQVIADLGSDPWSPINDTNDWQTNYSHATIRSASLALIGSGPAFTWKVPAGKPWRIYVFNRFFHPGAFDGQQVNAIDERLGKVFIDIALEPYAKRMGDKLGKSIPGDFIDHEGDYGWQLAWSESLDRRYRERYQRDIRLWLPLMLDTDTEGAFAKARWEWYDLVSDLYCHNFKEVTAWHEKRGMYTTAHVWEESIPAQVGCVGDHLKFLRSLTMPGQDCLTTKALYIHDFKEASSVAAFEGNRSMTELMGAGGWGVFNPVFLKQSVNAVIAWGVGHIIPHGVFTQRKLTGNPWMPDFYSENPIFPWMHLWNGFAARASYINSLGHAAPDVLLYNPIETAWMLSSIDMVDVDMWTFSDRNPNGTIVNAIDRRYSKAMADLTAGRVEFLVGDRHYLAQMKVDGPQLVRGPLSFRTLVLPPLRILSLDSARKMLAFAMAGGRVYALGELPTASVERGLGDPDMAALMSELSQTPGFTRCADEPAGCRSSWTYGPGWQFQDDATGFGLAPHIARSAPGLESPLRFVSGGFPMLQTRRHIDGRDFFWLVNNLKSKQVCEISVRGAKGAASIWNCETGETKAVSSTDTPDGSKLKMVFAPLEAYWLVFDPKLPAQKVAEDPAYGEWLTVSGPWQVKFNPEIQPVMEYPSTPPACFADGVEKALESWSAWGFPKFSGVMEYTKVFAAGQAPGPVRLDLGKVCHAAEVWMNGKAVGEKLW